ANARAWLAAGDPPEAAARARQALATFPDSPLHSDLYAVLGDAEHARGHEPPARAAWGAAREATRDDERIALLNDTLAQSYERTGHLEAAATEYRKNWLRHPVGEPGERAVVRLEKLEAVIGSTRDGSDYRRRADRLFRKRRNEEALVAYDRALREGLSKREQGRAVRQRAHTLFRMRSYPDALAAFRSLPTTADSELWVARSLARSGDVPAAIQAFENLARRNSGPTGVRARYLAGILLDGRGKIARARKHFERVARSRGAPELATAALWRLGWAGYREGRYAEAAKRFGLLARRERDPIAALRPRYWQARALERSNLRRAGTAFAELAREYPFSYYGLRARDRAIREGPELRPRPQPPARGRSRLKPRQLARPRILLEAGMREASEEALDRLFSRARGLDERLELAHLYRSAGNYNRAQRLVVDPYVEVLARGPQPALEELWWHSWPLAYEPHVATATKTPGSVERALVYAIMREESGYRPSVVSISGARGLLQIMSETGERLARTAGRPNFAPEDLFVPQTNIGLGALYLTQLRDRFGGRFSAAIASYNAGPTAVSGWVAGSAQEDDEWVESIPYDQTRTYVKRVMRSLHVYRVLY
ncbi:MAG: transglycosylase SLT domain-containing protein, partial [Proteobacteria bacterium]|nr:transglycosylase SLT domain-containing protein [Pseudomonadota bacterium]